MNSFIIKLPTLIDLFFDKKNSISRFYFGFVLTYLILPFTIWLWVIEFNLIMPAGGGSPLLRLFGEITAWIVLTGMILSPINTYRSRKLASVLHICILFLAPILFWKIAIVG